MAQMSKELMDLINGSFCYLGTASKDGVPNAVPIGSARAISPDTIAMAIGMIHKTWKNMQENPRASLTVHSELGPKSGFSKEKVAHFKGAQIKGSVSLATSGEMFEKMKAMIAQAMGPEAAATIGAAMLKVEEIYSITPGPEAGKRIV